MKASLKVPSKTQQAKGKEYYFEQSDTSNNSSSNSEGMIPQMVKYKLKTIALCQSLSAKNLRSAPVPTIKSNENPMLGSNSVLKLGSVHPSIHDFEHHTSDDEPLLYSNKTTSLKTTNKYDLESDNTTFWNESSMETVADVVTDMSNDISQNEKGAKSSDESDIASFDLGNETSTRPVVKVEDAIPELPLKASSTSANIAAIHSDVRYMPLEAEVEKMNLESWLTYGAVMKLNSEHERLKYASDIFDSLYDRHFQNITCDVRVKVGEEVFQTNRFLLNHHSKKLGDVLATSDLVKTSQVSLIEVPTRIFQNIYDWMYGKSVDLSAGEITQVFYFAQELGFRELVDEIKQLQTKMLSADHAPDMYLFAKVNSIDALEVLAMHLMTTSFEKLVTNDGFLKLPPTVFFYLLKQDNLRVETENHVVAASFSWLTYDGANDYESLNGDGARSRHQYADAIFLLIRLESMPLQQFLELPKLIEGWLQLRNYLGEQSARPASVDFILKRWNKRMLMAQRYQLAKLSGWRATSTLSLVPAGHLMRPRRHVPKGSHRNSSQTALKGNTQKVRSLALKHQLHQEPSKESQLQPSNRMTSAISQGNHDYYFEIMPDVTVPNNLTHQTLQSLIENLPVTIQLQQLEQWLSHSFQRLWNDPSNRQKRCLNVIQQLRKKETLQSTADVIMVAEDVEFKMHRCLLLHHFPHLGEKLYCSEVGFQPRVSVYGVRVHMIDFFVKWMYAADLSLDEEAGLTYSKVGDYAKHFGFQPLLKLWTRLTDDLLDPFFALEVIEDWKAKEKQHQHESLAKFAYTMIMKRFGRVVRDKRYLNLSHPTVCWLLSRDELYIKSELEIFEAASNWLNFNWTSRQHLASRVMNCVRYTLMDTKELLALATTKDSILSVLNSDQRDSQWERLNSAMQRNMLQLIDAGGETMTANEPPRINMGKMIVEDLKPAAVASDEREPALGKEAARFGPSYDIMVFGCRTASKRDVTAADQLEAQAMWRLNRAEQQWEAEKTAMPEIFKDMAVIVLNHFIYVTGGVSCTGGTGTTMSLTPTARVLQYDLIEKQWTSLAPMNIERVYHSGVALNGYLYVIGGMDGEGHFLSEVERYDPVNCTWSFVQGLQRPRAASAAAAHRGCVWVVGGLEKHGHYKIVSNAVECYSPDQDSWQMMRPLEVPMLFAVLLEHDSRLYLIGGATSDTHYQKGKDLQVVRSVAVYNDEKNEWVYETTLRSDRLRFAAGIFTDSSGTYLLVTGGRDSNQAYISSVDCYNLKSQRWQPESWVPNLPFALQSHCCLQVPSSIKTS